MILEEKNEEKTDKVTDSVTESCDMESHFNNLLKGRLLPWWRNGDWRHTPAWDEMEKAMGGTFSNISVLLLAVLLRTPQPSSKTFLQAQEKGESLLELPVGLGEMLNECQGESLPRSMCPPDGL